jgi:histidinol-phosphatase
VPAAPDDLKLAHELADLADEITLSRFRAEDLQVETKPDLTPVSEADRAVEQAMRERLAELRPDDSVFGEEYGSSTAPDSRRRWIVDPIDGTKNYVRGIPVWATLLALEEDGQLHLALTSAPALRRRWWAMRGEGAFADDGLGGGARQIHVSAVGELAHAQLSTSGSEGGGAERFAALSAACGRRRDFGDFWSYMLVAEGALEIACDLEASLWDLAPMQLIVEEAGGRFSDLRGVRTAAGGDGIATNGLLHDAALALLS